MFRIGEFSKIAQVSGRLLRYYDEIGLLSPEFTDPQTGYRYYSARQLPRLNRILVLKELGLSLEQIARLLDRDTSADEIRGMLTLRKAPDRAIGSGRNGEAACSRGATATDRRSWADTEPRRCSQISSGTAISGVTRSAARYGCGQASRPENLFCCSNGSGAQQPRPHRRCSSFSNV